MELPEIEWISTADAARIAGVSSTQTVRDWIARGEPIEHKATPDGRIRIRRDSLTKWLASKAKDRGRSA